jgi:hypothetical protein
LLELRKPFKYDDGTEIYIGEWNTISNLREGFGQVIRSDGSYFKGYFIHNSSNGLIKDFYSNSCFDG